MKDDNYIVCHGWMINHLELSANELLVFSVIHGFSQDEQSEFTGSLNYLAGCINGSQQTVMNTLKKLVEKELIIKTERYQNNVKFCSYKVNFTTTQKFRDPTQKFWEDPTQKFRVNNTNINTNINTNNNAVQPKASPQNNLEKSSKLVSAKNNSKSNLANKEDKFRKMATDIIDEFDFTDKISDLLYNFIDMLVEVKALLPASSIRTQISAIRKISENDMETVITTAIAGGYVNLVNGIKYLPSTQRKNDSPMFINRGKPEAAKGKLSDMEGDWY